MRRRRTVTVRGTKGDVERELRAILPGLQRAVARRFDEAVRGLADGDGIKMAARP